MPKGKESKPIGAKEITNMKDCEGNTINEIDPVNTFMVHGVTNIHSTHVSAQQREERKESVVLNGMA